MATRELMADLTTARCGDPAGPLLVVIHGWGEDEERALRIAERFDPYGSFHTVAPRGPNQVRGGYSWFRNPADERGTRAAIGELREFIVTEAEGRDPGMSCVIGFSEGAAAALALGYGTNPIGVRWVIAIAGFQPRNITFAGERPLPLPPVLLMRGKNDKTISWKQSDHLARTLEGMGATVAVRTFDGGHYIPTDALLEARLWADEISS